MQTRMRGLEAKILPPGLILPGSRNILSPSTTGLPAIILDPNDDNRHHPHHTPTVDAYRSAKGGLGTSCRPTMSAMASSMELEGGGPFGAMVESPGTRVDFSHARVRRTSRGDIWMGPATGTEPRFSMR